MRWKEKLSSAACDGPLWQRIGVDLLDEGWNPPIRRRCGEMADAPDLKSVGIHLPCRFESGQRHPISE